MEIETFLKKSLKNKIDFDDALYLYNNFSAIDLLYLAFKIKNRIKNNSKIKLCAIINAKVENAKRIVFSALNQFIVNATSQYIH